MDETQLRTLMIKDPVTRPYFGGILAADELPFATPSSKTFYIVNSDKSTGKGEHWTVMYFNNQSEFFDSLGKHPGAYDENFVDILMANGPNYVYSTKRLQSYMSALCGEFCVYFCHHRCLGYSFVEIINMFSHNLQLNDVKVELFVNRLIEDLFE